MDQKKTGQFIMQLRKEKGYTQKKLAEEIGISDKAVSKWETGNGMPDTGLLAPLCKALDITVNELLSGERLKVEEYSVRAEDNIINLLNESRKVSKNGIIKAVIGYVLVVACLFLNVNNIVNIKWYFDLPSLIYIVVMGYAVVLISGKRGKTEIIRILRRTVIPIGAALSLIGIISSLGHIEDMVIFGQSLYVSLMALLYSIFAYIILAILDKN